MNTGDLQQGSIKAEFLIPGRESTRALQQRDTIQYIRDLFNVLVYAGAHHPRGEWVTLNGTQDNIAKAKKYILAKCMPDMRLEVPSSPAFASFLLSDGTKIHRELEKDYQVVITVGASGTVLVQGVEADLYKVSSQLYSLKDTFMSTFQAPEPPRQPVTKGSTSRYPLNIPYSSPDQVYHYPANPSLVPRGTGRLDTQINYYVKLGYPREKVEAVFRSSPGATDDVILKRLIEATHTQRVERPDRELMPQRPVTVNPDQLRPVVIDGSNVAMRHGNGQVFSCRGIQLAVNYFKSRGHTSITVFVPEWRKEASTPESPIAEQHILHSLEQDGYLKYTPSRRLEDRRLIVCYDDKFIVRLAIEEQGVIVSNDQYRDLIKENPGWKDFIEKRLLQFTFAGDHFMPPDDPRGRNGPSLDQLLSKDLYSGSPSSRPTRKQNKTVIARQPGVPEVCPHLNRCTFGKKCRYYHPPADTEGSTGSTTHTPSTSRSPTPSPSPDKHYRIDHRSREDLERPHSGRSDMHSDLNISELGEHMAGLRVTGKPDPPQSINFHPRIEHQSPGQMRSAPTLPTPQDQSFRVPQLHEQRRTHPLMNVPQGHFLDRPRRVTEDFSHQIGQSSYPNVSPSHRPHTEHLYDTKHLQHQMSGFPGPRATLMRSEPNYPSQGGLLPRDPGDYVYPEPNDHYQARISNPSPIHPPHAHTYTTPPPPHQSFRHHPQGESLHQQHGSPPFNRSLYQQALAVYPGCQDRVARLFAQFPGINSLQEVVEFMNSRTRD